MAPCLIIVGYHNQLKKIRSSQRGLKSQPQIPQRPSQQKPQFVPEDMVEVKGPRPAKYDFLNLISRSENP